MFSFNSMCRLRGRDSVYCKNYCNMCDVKVSKNNVLDKNSANVSKKMRNAGFTKGNRKTIIQKVVCK